MDTIKLEKNADKECKDYVEANTVLKIEEEIKELESNMTSIDSIIQMETPKPMALQTETLEEPEPQAPPEEHPELSESILGLETLDIKDEDLENMFDETRCRGNFLL